MRILVDINHPAHVHFFRNFISNMQKRGHKVLITSTQKDLTFELLKNYGLEFKKLGSYGSFLLAKILNIPVIDWRLYKVAKEFKPDLILGLGSFAAAHTAKFLKKPCLIFEDSEPTPFEHLLYAPFATKILTPAFFKKNFGKKQERYNSFHEMAYLHPRYFKPDKRILSELGVKPGEKFFIIRFVGWQAGHDLGRRGFSRNEKLELVSYLNSIGKVFITSERETLPELDKYLYKILPQKMHQALYYADG